MSLHRLHDILFPPASPAKFNHLLSKHGLLDSCPIPPPPYSHPLASLLNQSSSHVSSPDFKLLLETCMQRMTVAVLDRLAIEVYDEIDIIPVNDGYEQGQPVARIESQKTRRVVECLPFLTRWSGDIWAHVPAEPIEVSRVSCVFPLVLGVCIVTSVNVHFDLCECVANNPSESSVSPSLKGLQRSFMLILAMVLTTHDFGVFEEKSQRYVMIVALVRYRNETQTASSIISCIQWP